MHAAQLPQAGLDPFRQGLETFRKAQRDRFHIGVGQHQVEHHVGKRRSSQRHPEIGHMREVRLRRFAWFVTLGEHHLLLRAGQRSPHLNVALQRSHLPLLVAPRMLGAQERKQRHRLQRRVPF